MLRRTIALPLLLLLLLAAQALTAEPPEWRSKSYRELAAYPLSLIDADSPVRVTAPMIRQSDGTTPPDLEVELLLNGQHIPIKIAQDGSLALPWRHDWADQGAQLRTRTRATGLEYGFGLSFNLKPAPGETPTHLSYAQLEKFAVAISDTLNRLSVLMGQETPQPVASLQGFLFVFDQPGATGSVVTAQGVRRAMLQADPTTLRLPLDPALHDAWIELSAPTKALVPMLGAPVTGKG